MTDIATREQLLVRALPLGVFSVAWNALECFVAISAAWIAGSRALARFDLDSANESVSASVLLLRIGAERRDPDRAEHVEHVATRAIGASFLLLG